MQQSWKEKGNEEGTKALQRRRKNGRAYGQEKPRHLYIVLDDWSWGYSIRKIDLSFGGDPAHQVTPHSSWRHCSRNILPSASFKFEAPRGHPKYFANAFGSKILAMQPMDSKFKKNSMDGVLIYDVGMRSVTVGPRQKPDPVDPIYIPVGGSLFALGDGSFQVLYPQSHQPDRKDFVWHTLQEPPFAHQLVTSYAVHSDGRIFFSIQGPCPATFSFDTAESVTNINCGWKYHGKWVMPFYGRAYFVPELDACVGFVGKSGRHGCCIGAIEYSFDGNLALKLCEDDFTCVTEERDIGATLVSLGGSKFCLLKYMRLGSDDVLTGSSTSKENLKEEEVILQLVKFSLKYDKNGALRKGRSCHVDCYGVPSGVTLSMISNPVAFWM